MEQNQANNTDFGRSVAGVALRDGKVLLGRHTYGGGKGKLIIPGGYIDRGESAEKALVREFMEETGVVVEPEGIIGIRFNLRDWYVVFRAKYVSGEAVADQEENSEVIWMDVGEALQREDVPDLTKQMIALALKDGGLEAVPYQYNPKYGEASLYG